MKSGLQISYLTKFLQTKFGCSVEVGQDYEVGRGVVSADDRLSSLANLS